MGIINLTKPSRPQRDAIPPNPSTSQILLRRGNIFLKNPQLPRVSHNKLYSFPCLEPTGTGSGEEVPQDRPSPMGAPVATRVPRPPSAPFGQPFRRFPACPDQGTDPTLGRPEHRPPARGLKPLRRSPTPRHTLYFEQRGRERLGHEGIALFPGLFCLHLIQSSCGLLASFQINFWVTSAMPSPSSQAAGKQPIKPTNKYRTYWLIKPASNTAI